MRGDPSKAGFPTVNMVKSWLAFFITKIWTLDLF